MDKKNNFSLPPHTEQAYAEYFQVTVSGGRNGLINDFSFDMVYLQLTLSVVSFAFSCNSCNSVFGGSGPAGGWADGILLI